MHSSVIVGVCSRLRLWIAWTQCVRQHEGQRHSTRSFLASKVTGRASSEAQLLRIRAGSRSGPVPKCSSRFFSSLSTLRTRSRRKPLCSARPSCCISVYWFVFAAGSCDFAWKVLANSLALSSGVIAQLPSARCSAGMFSEVSAFVNKVFAIFHQPREEGSKDFSVTICWYSWR